MKNSDNFDFLIHSNHAPQKLILPYCELNPSPANRSWLSIRRASCQRGSRIPQSLIPPYTRRRFEQSVSSSAEKMAQGVSSVFSFIFYRILNRLLLLSFPQNLQPGTRASAHLRPARHPECWQTFKARLPLRRKSHGPLVAFQIHSGPDSCPAISIQKAKMNDFGVAQISRSRVCL